MPSIEESETFPERVHRLIQEAELGTAIGAQAVLGEPARQHTERERFELLLAYAQVHSRLLVDTAAEIQDLVRRVTALERRG